MVQKLQTPLRLRVTRLAPAPACSVYALLLIKAHHLLRTRILHVFVVKKGQICTLTTSTCICSKLSNYKECWRIWDALIRGYQSRFITNNCNTVTDLFVSSNNRPYDGGHFITAKCKSKFVCL